MNYQQIYLNINQFCCNDDESTKSIIEVINTSLIETMNELNNLNIVENKTEIEKIAHKVLMTFTLVGDIDLIKINKILESGNYGNMNQAEINTMYIEFKALIKALMLALN